MPTTNPVPSQDPSDLLFNAGKLDEVLNGTGTSFTDRLGTARRTVAGMNADFGAQLADAESDLNVYRADAAASAAEALGYLQTIRATSYGAYATDPATDPLGNPPTVGDEYFNTTANLLKRWSGATWQASDINTANLAAPTGASLVGYTPAGTGAVATTAQSKLRESVSVLDFYANGVDGVRVDPTGTIDSTKGIQAAIDSGASRVELPEGTYSFTSITLKPTLLEFVGKGASSVGTYLKRKAGATGSALKWDGTNRITQAFVGHFRMDCNSEAAETYGLDLSGFSYCTFENIWIRLAKLDGVYADGSITPVNKQFSNNTFINVRSNNNLRDGWRFDGSIQANSANTYVGCEGAGNIGIGFNELVGYANQTVGCTFQGNTGKDFYTNGSRNKHDFYAEGGVKTVELGYASSANVFSARSSYPLWNTFIDNGVANTCSIRGEVEPERHIFDNPFFMNWISTAPQNTTLLGTPTLASYTDINSPVNAGVQVTVNGAFQGLSFILDDVKESLKGKWVTLIVEIDTSGIGANTIQTRVNSSDGGILNENNGEFAVENLPVSSANNFIRLAYDVKFKDVLSSTCAINWYIAYSGAPGGGVAIKIRSARIVMGQTRNASQYVGVEIQHAATTGVLSAASNGINTHRKYAGRLAYETSTGKMRYATGTLATSAWRATDGSGDVTPV